MVSKNRYQRLSINISNIPPIELRTAYKPDIHIDSISEVAKSSCLSPTKVIVINWFYSLKSDS